MMLLLEVLVCGGVSFHPSSRDQCQKGLARGEGALSNILLVVYEQI